MNMKKQKKKKRKKINKMKQIFFKKKILKQTYCTHINLFKYT